MRFYWGRRPSCEECSACLDQQQITELDAGKAPGIVICKWVEKLSDFSDDQVPACTAALAGKAGYGAFARGEVVRLAAEGYLRGMKLTRTNLWLAAAAAMLLTASCSQAPDAADAEKDPGADATYKRAHRAEGYREAQRSNVTR